MVTMAGPDTSHRRCRHRFSLAFGITCNILSLLLAEMVAKSQAAFAIKATIDVVVIVLDSPHCHHRHEGSQSCPNDHPQHGAEPPATKRPSTKHRIVPRMPQPVRDTATAWKFRACSLCRQADDDDSRPPPPAAALADALETSISIDSRSVGVYSYLSCGVFTSPSPPTITSLRCTTTPMARKDDKSGRLPRNIEIANVHTLMGNKTAALTEDHAEQKMCSSPPSSPPPPPMKTPLL